MANLNINYAICIVFSLFIATLVSVSAISLGADYICIKNEKLANFRYYTYDVLGGPNTTLYEVARANISTAALLSFGKIYVSEVVITATSSGPDTDVLGTAQGIVTFADKNMSSAEMVFNVVFTAGKYNGSTLSISGHNRVLAQRRQMPVVGGTGVFRFTRGYAVVTIISNTIGADSYVYTTLEYALSVTYCPSL